MKNILIVIKLIEIHFF